MSSEELEISRLSYDERQEAFEQLIRSAARMLPFIRGSRNPRRPVFRTGQFRGVVQLARVKGRYVPPRRPDRIRKSKRQKALHILAAADRAIAELQG
jgi:hypothetical protein